MMVAKNTLVGLLLQATLISAYPHLAAKIAEQRRQAVPPTVPFPEFPGLPHHALYDKFDSKAQLVSTTGDHRFIAPSPGDIRGPCPGLNAAANHNYLPRDGIATFVTVQTGLWEAFGLDQTATEFLQQTTTFFDGDPLSQKWSIGFASDKVSALGPISQLLGSPTGICAYGHLKSEGDASITRGDFLAPEKNSNCASYPEFYQELLDLAKKRNNGNINAPVLAEHQHNRKLHSIATNPNYFAPAFAGVAFTPAAHLFVFELMANRSAEHPRGLLTPEVLDAFFSYTRNADGSLNYVYGHERIPDNWYRRAQDDAWTLPDIVAGIASQCLAFPATCQVGGNVNGVNSFAGVDLGDISGGLINAEQLSDPQKLGCFISQNIQAEAPSSLEKVFTGVLLQQALSSISTKLLPALSPLGACQDLPKGKTITQYGNIFPGAKVQAQGPRASQAY